MENNKVVWILPWCTVATEKYCTAHGFHFHWTGHSRGLSKRLSTCTFHCLKLARHVLSRSVVHNPGLCFQCLPAPTHVSNEWIVIRLWTSLRTREWMNSVGSYTKTRSASLVPSTSWWNSYLMNTCTSLSNLQSVWIRFCLQINADIS